MCHVKKKTLEIKWLDFNGPSNILPSSCWLRLKVQIFVFRVTLERMSQIFIISWKLIPHPIICRQKLLVKWEPVCFSSSLKSNFFFFKNSLEETQFQSHNFFRQRFFWSFFLFWQSRNRDTSFLDDRLISTTINYFAHFKCNFDRKWTVSRTLTDIYEVIESSV